MIDYPTLNELPDDLLSRLRARGFDADQLIAWAKRVGEGDERNRLEGEVELVPEGMLERLPADAQERAAARVRGERALANKELAICVLAGGMATRMGGVVKSLLPVHDKHTFLDLRLAERTAIAQRHGAAPPLWLMTSEPTDGPITEALAARGLTGEADVATFEQLVSLRLTEAGDLFTDEDGQPSVYATGHGDLPDALKRSGLLERFVAGGGRYVWISNIDNLGARIDAAVLGQHILDDRALTVDVVDKAPGDKGGGPVLLDGEPIIAEHFRLPKGFDADAVPVFNTNTFLVDAQRLLALDMDWTYVQVSKSVSAPDPRTAVQFERLLGEITVGIRPSFQHVSRDTEGDAAARSRFLPVKTHEDLEAARPAIATIAASLGLT